MHLDWTLRLLRGFDISCQWISGLGYRGWILLNFGAGTGTWALGCRAQGSGLSHATKFQVGQICKTKGTASMDSMECVM